ncbi:NAD/NADP-dependent octopine/nopaline dehydrogenase family protein [Paenibacillus sabinae]|uniref:NAD/NADP octopine/nopaline dehydrogenase n=1 Tax=Paenibacillus sabinae T27 TaxID=1268072 RepID=X4ZDU3_9BACL|nr:NAD/NADP-dependent octopine/nopaline dehydrogenase family protein [Paenibacillus sabinae]AHV95652.1 NAD/NADP octopine/nopaline dehydrogenase [Paenibacillus sabinae T27]
MEIAVIGGGHGCYAAAADLSDKGHHVRLWRRGKEAFQPVLESQSLILKDAGGVRKVSLSLASTDLSAVVKGAALIVLPLPAFAQASVASELAPHLQDGQVIFLPPGTFGSYVMAKALAEAGSRAKVAFAETGTLPYLARKHGADTVAVSGRATRLPTGVFPGELAEQAFAVLEEAFPAVERLQDALDGALMNAGPIIHPPLILMNAGPIEHFEHWDIHNEGTQPSVRRVHNALDAERIAVREALGYRAPHFPLADHYSKDGDEWMYGNAAHEKLVDSSDWREHLDLMTHRYMREDVACGLAFLVSLADWAGMPAPVAKGLLAIASAVTGEDLRETGRTLENLQLSGLSVNGMRMMLQQGVRQWV